MIGLQIEMKKDTEDIFLNYAGNCRRKKKICEWVYLFIDFLEYQDDVFTSVVTLTLGTKF